MIVNDCQSVLRDFIEIFGIEKLTTLGEGTRRKFQPLLGHDPVNTCQKKLHYNLKIGLLFIASNIVT